MEDDIFGLLDSRAATHDDNQPPPPRCRKYRLTITPALAHSVEDYPTTAGYRKHAGCRRNVARSRREAEQRLKQRLGTFGTSTSRSAGGDCLGFMEFTMSVVIIDGR